MQFIVLTLFFSFLPKLLCTSVLGAVSIVLLLSSIQWYRHTWMIYKQTKWKVCAQRSLQSSAWMLQLLSRGWDCCVHVLSTWKLWLKALILQSALLVRNGFRPQSCSRLHWLGAQCLRGVWQQASPADRAMQWGPSLLYSVCYDCKSTSFLSFKFFFLFFFFFFKEWAASSHILCAIQIWGNMWVSFNWQYTEILGAIWRYSCASLQSLFRQNSCSLQ